MRDVARTTTRGTQAAIPFTDKRSSWSPDTVMLAGTKNISNMACAGDKINRVATYIAGTKEDSGKH